MNATNLSWFFNVEYYEGLLCMDHPAKLIEERIAERNQQLIKANPPIPVAKAIPGERCFDLQTQYPGLLVGTGYHHNGGLCDGEIVSGFSLDYVTGLPYLPGSSLKGVLRAAFSHAGYIRELLGDEKADVPSMERSIFGESQREKKRWPLRDQDVFLDAFPLRGDGQGLMELESITPHHSGDLGELSHPIPIMLVKVRPGVVFRFRFLLGDTPALPRDKKLELFRQILLDLGAGAKTNVGFGRFTDAIAPPKSARAVSNGPAQDGLCGDCGQPTKPDPKTGSYHTYCHKCNDQRITRGKRR